MPIYLLDRPSGDALDVLPYQIVRRAGYYDVQERLELCTCGYFVPPTNIKFHRQGCGYRRLVESRCAFFASADARRNPLARIQQTNR